MTSVHCPRRFIILAALICAALLPATPVLADTSYIVQPGDTLTRIAARFNTTVEALVQANHLPNADSIRVGQALTIPDGASPPAPAGPARYVVQPGDSLARIAARFHIDVDALIKANGLTTTTLQPGQTLIIPSAGAPVAPAALAQRIRGDATFTRRIQAALDWLQAQDPEVYGRVEQYVTEIKSSPYRDLAQARPAAGGCLVLALARRDMSTPMIAAMLFHETVHCQQFAAGGGLNAKEAEVQAYTEQLAFMTRHSFPDEELAYYEKVLMYYQSQPDDGRPIPPPDF